jgi:cytochrome b561
MPHVGHKTVNEGWVPCQPSLGVAILAVIVARFAWRLFHPVAMPDALAKSELVAWRFTYLTPYALALA